MVRARLRGTIARGGGLAAVRTAHLAPEDLPRAAEILVSGGLVAFPTETVYGLGADARNDRAVGGVFAAKGRPADNPLIVHVRSAEEAQEIAVLDRRAQALTGRFWPGPLTLVLVARTGVSSVARAGLSTVAVRCPDHPLALALLRMAGCPIAAPSANRSGRPSPTSAPDVFEELDGRIDAVLDGGTCRIGVESTVVDATGEHVTLLRPGGLPREDIEEVAGAVLSPSREPGQPKSPGLRHRHYAPSVPVLVVNPGADAVLRALYDHPAASVLCTVETAAEIASAIPGLRLLTIGRRGDAGTAARRLFGALRELERYRPEAIIAESVAEDAVGLAVMDRLRRAAAASATDH